MTFHRSEYIKTSRGTVMFAGVPFNSYRVGINSYALISSDGRCKVKRNGTTYYAAVDDSIIGDRYRSEISALTAAFDKAYGS